MPPPKIQWESRIANTAEKGLLHSPLQGTADGYPVADFRPEADQFGAYTSTLVDTLILYLSYKSNKLIEGKISLLPSAKFRRYLCFGNWQEILFDALGQQRLYFEYVASDINPLWQSSSYLSELPMAKALNDAKLPSELKFPIEKVNAIGKPYTETMVEQFIWVGRTRPSNTTLPRPGTAPAHRAAPPASNPRSPHPPKPGPQRRFDDAARSSRADDSPSGSVRPFAQTCRDLW